MSKNSTPEAGAKSLIVLVLNGPNLNLLGTREPDIYGKETLADVEQACRSYASAHQFSVEFRQSNHEGQLIDWIQEARGKVGGIVVNPGGFGHTSVAIADALKGVELPVIEVHISNIFAREPFRHHSTISAIAKGVICGLGPRGYILALDAMRRIIAGAAISE